MVQDEGKLLMLLILIKHQRPDIQKIYLYVKDSFQSKYQLVINEREKVGIEILKKPKALADYSQTMDAVYENLEDYHPTKKRKVLIVFDNMIADMGANKKSPIVTELFLRGKSSIFHLFLYRNLISKCLKL